MTEEQLQVIKERAEMAVPPNGIIIRNQLPNVKELIVQDIPQLVAEVERLREGLETIANHNMFKVPQIIMRDYAREVLEGEKP